MYHTLAQLLSISLFCFLAKNIVLFKCLPFRDEKPIHNSRRNLVNKTITGHSVALVSHSCWDMLAENVLAKYHIYICSFIWERRMEGGKKERGQKGGRGRKTETSHQLVYSAHAHNEQIQKMAEATCGTSRLPLKICISRK